MLGFVHIALASALKSPELILTEAEAQRLADATVQVMRHYDLPAVGQVTRDWVALIVVCYGIYWVRIKSIVERTKKNARVADQGMEDNPLEFAARSVG